MSNSEIVITYDKLDINAGVMFVTSPMCGAINTFLGVVRGTDIDGSRKDHSRPIRALYYEAYEPMARKQISKIIDTVVKGSDLEIGSHISADDNTRTHVALRLGQVLVSEASIMICVASTGRDLSHYATLAILREIKSHVAIWKKIVFSDGDESWADSKSEAEWIKCPD